MQGSADRAVGTRCQARPLTRRHREQDDLLCASPAIAHVLHRGQRVPVCGLHHRTYERWDRSAESNATEWWDWPPGTASG